MTPDIPSDLLRTAAEWPALHRWERKQLGLALRRLGLTHSEIQSIIPVPKGTLSNWSQEVSLSEEQRLAIIERAGPMTRKGIPVDTQWRRRREIEAIRTEARMYAIEHIDDSFFVGGVVLYWGEGSKTRNFLGLSNADPAALRLYVAWVRTFLDEDAQFVMALHLHEGNDDEAARQYWRSELDLPDTPFTKTYIKPKGTGHRKNHLAHGVCRVRVRNASDHWHRVMVWIEIDATRFGSILNASR